MVTADEKGTPKSLRKHPLLLTETKGSSENSLKAQPKTHLRTIPLERNRGLYRGIEVTTLYHGTC